MFAYYAKWIPNFSEKAKRRLLQASNFPIGPEAERAFKELNDLGRASLGSIREGVPFEIKTDAPDNALAAVPSQGGRPVAFHVSHPQPLRETISCHRKGSDSCD